MAQIEILKVGMHNGETAKGNVSRKIWGYANVNGVIHTFWGRANGKLRTKAVLGREARATWFLKTGGRTDGGDVYGELNDNTRLALVPTLSVDVQRAVSGRC